jgi:hypothetical protein
MQVHAGDRHGELAKPIEGRFFQPPIVSVSPVSDELLKVIEARPVPPIRSGHFVRPLHAIEPLTQIFDHVVMDVQRERAGRSVGSSYIIRQTDQFSH